MLSVKYSALNQGIEKKYCIERTLILAKRHKVRFSRLTLQVWRGGDYPNYWRILGRLIRTDVGVEERTSTLTDSPPIENRGTRS